MSQSIIKRFIGSKSVESQPCGSSEEDDVLLAYGTYLLQLKFVALVEEKVEEAILHDCPFGEACGYQCVKSTGLLNLEPSGTGTRVEYLGQERITCSRLGDCALSGEVPKDMHDPAVAEVIDEQFIAPHL